MQNETRLPRLLDGDFRERKRLRPTALSLSLERSACSTRRLRASNEPSASRRFIRYKMKGPSALTIFRG